MIRAVALLALLLAGEGKPAAMTAPTAPPPLRPPDMRELAREHYRWYFEQFPVAATDAGLHEGDGRLASYAPATREGRRRRAAATLAALATADTSTWSMDDRADLVLFRAAVKRVEFDERVLRRARRDPGLYVEECTNGIFSLIKKDYAPRPERARAAIARLRAMPELLTGARAQLDEMVPLLARLATQAAEGAGPLFHESLGILVEAMDERERRDLEAARREALAALRGFASWLRARESSLKAPLAIGRESYEEMLREIYLLPFDASQLVTLGQVELARTRALEAWLPDPGLADTLAPPSGTPLPADAREYLERYEARTADLMDHLERREILTVPAYIGPFRIQELPAAFRPTSPGGFMNPPGPFDTDPSGFYFLPAFDPKSDNFYVRAALSNPLPILGHEGIPGHFLQISIANHNPVEIRRLHGDGVFQEGWALYCEEMLMRTGLYDASPEGTAQVLRLMRYRAARIPVDVRLATGEWTFQQAVDFFMKEGGLDREAATGEAAGAAVTPGQKMNYIVGKSQIQRLLGLYRARRGADFRLREFHDHLLSYGSLPLSVIEWLMLGDETTLRSVDAAHHRSR